MMVMPLIMHIGSVAFTDHIFMILFIGTTGIMIVGTGIHIPIHPGTIHHGLMHGIGAMDTADGIHPIPDGAGDIHHTTAIGTGLTTQAIGAGDILTTTGHGMATHDMPIPIITVTEEEVRLVPVYYTEIQAAEEQIPRQPVHQQYQEGMDLLTVLPQELPVPPAAGTQVRPEAMQI